ncbi:MAG: hypothetical protein Q7V20_14170 [Aquabacterium sp.]|uniref:hypothetical protein n=1 Tax=Aquabacterium sp. TaxID=1872578 RepID=UPI00271B2034|nr:hypothetical protein [Aquabacterium sp.]MDO9004590.1 hypothetical protein [Aquabacterium sp.]
MKDSSRSSHTTRTRVTQKLQLSGSMIACLAINLAGRGMAKRSSIHFGTHLLTFAKENWASKNRFQINLPVMSADKRHLVGPMQATTFQIIY